ncbi:M20 family metallopeptidase [Micromonospora sp. 4G57]|uniref:M20 family metallopeptidase n=1 Tax=Micromonospora sicca TaxID=2202420 RepID=A0ABU5JM26_9ACTN|nr:MULTISPECIES: M20 family metallopeptidase [unclassified Micromonospora]MDZ5446981.1 M20 family metallopeptidase [Micromonospora sp. 4G57]MDZ5493658.1 M20 family metallopeptidase [Micromonospora sp. 4G53]
MKRLPTASVVDAVDVEALHGWVVDRARHLVDDLVALAELETPSDDRELLAKGVTFVEEWVLDRLGAPARRVRHESAEHGSTLVLDYSGTGQRQVVGLGHYDTVFGAGTTRSWPVRVDGDRVSGPGVFDMKGGLVQLMWSLRALHELGVPRPPVRLVLNGDEEIGSPFSRPVLEQAVADAAAVLVFEASADGAVKTARKGVGLFDVTARGVESHAGLDPEAGASAIDELARVITTLHAGADLKRGTSINVGVVSGGTRANVVAGFAQANIDVRVATAEEEARVDALLASLAPRDERVKLEVSGGWNRPVMPRSDEIGRMYALARRAAARLGVDLREASVGGASDGNFAAALGIPVLDGFGAVGGGAHARHEHVSITGMVERTALAASVIAAFAVE